MIDSVEDGSTKDLSAAYRFDAVPKEGVFFQGRCYLFTMRNLIGNYLAIVSDGRVTGAMIGDALPREFRRSTPSHHGCR